MDSKQLSVDDSLEGMQRLNFSKKSVDNVKSRYTTEVEIKDYIKPNEESYTSQKHSEEKFQSSGSFITNHLEEEDTVNIDLLDNESDNELNELMNLKLSEEEAGEDHEMIFFSQDVPNIGFFH
jgi:hypothetical protein